MIDVEIDFSELTAFVDNLQSHLTTKGYSFTTSLVESIWFHIVEEANSILRSRQEAYLDALSIDPDGSSAWKISLGKSALWIEDGMQPHSMIQNLLFPKNGKAKTKRGYDGSLYRDIPFEHSDSKSTNTAGILRDVVVAQARQRGLSIDPKSIYQKGSPRGQKIGSMDVADLPLKTQPDRQGYGPIGGVMQGATGTPFLRDIRLYKKKDILGAFSIRAFTFRRVSDNSTAQWFHPGLQPVHIFDRTFDWAIHTLIPEMEADGRF